MFFGQLPLVEGFIIFLHLNKESLWALFWPCVLHKCTRKAAMAIGLASEAKSNLKSLNRLFRCTRSPFNTSAHGKILQSARKQLLEAILRNECEDLMDMWLPGICRDLDIDPSEFTVGMLIEILKKKAGLFCFHIYMMLPKVHDRHEQVFFRMLFQQRVANISFRLSSLMRLNAICLSAKKLE